MNWRSLSPWGLVIALLGFSLTRITVTLATDESMVRFLFAGVIPLMLGLSLAAFGVVLMVGAYERRLVRTTALWSLVGTGAMGVLVLLTILGDQPDLTSVAEFRRQTYLSNFLIGGAVGGTLTGLYAARNQRQRRDLQQQANRLILLNRLLRDTVINSATAIKGHADILSDSHQNNAVEVIDEQADNVIETVENVKYLSNTADSSGQSLGSVDVVSTLEARIDALNETFPETEFSCETPDEAICVRANAQLSEVFHQLLVNAAEYGGEGATVAVAADLAPNHVTVRITDSGPGLPSDQRALLEAGEIAEFDDPTTGFGLNIVRLLVESFDGEIDTAVDESGTTVSVRLKREHPEGSTAGGITAPGVSPSRIALAVGTSLLAGAVMGVGMVATGGNVPVIGALYGIENLFVAAVSHGFHSVVFGLVYASLLSVASSGAVQFRSRLLVAVGFGVVLWLVAAGLVMPLWLRAVGIEATVPMVTVSGLVGHLLWALTLGTSYHYGDRWLADTSARGGQLSALERLSHRIRQR
jgi:signal transduction histidine kinase